MLTDTATELDQFQWFLERLRADGDCKLSLDDCVAEFRLYQDELERCREAIRPSLEASLRGESTPWDPEEMKRRIREWYPDAPQE